MGTSNTETTTTGTVTIGFEIVTDTYRGYGFNVTRDGVALTDRYGSTRNFTTRNSARKRISRELRGDFHN
jgi:hypothetical protein